MFRLRYLRSQFAKAIREALDAIGGTGVQGYSTSDYIKDQLGLIGHDEAQLELGIKCFGEVKDNARLLMK